MATVQTKASITVRVNGDSIEGYILSDGGVDAYCRIQKKMIRHANVLAWIDYWCEEH